MHARELAEDAAQVLLPQRVAELVEALREVYGGDDDAEVLVNEEGIEY